MGGGSGQWEGHAELQAALEGLATAKGTSANRVKAVSNAAFKYSKDYKRVVHDIELFLWKADVEHRLAGLYAMDAVMRQGQGKLGAKDPFVKRFLLHMSHTISAVKKIPVDSQASARHVIEEWQTRGYYTPADIESAGGQAYSLNNPEQRPAPTIKTDGASKTITRASPTHADPASKEKLASLLSIIKKQKELKEQNPPPPPLPVSPPARVSIPPPSTSRPDRRDDDRDRDRERRGSFGRRQDDSPMRDRSRRSPPPRSPPRSRVRSERDERRDGGWDEPREVKKPRGSRWGPPRPGGMGSDVRDDTRDDRRPGPPPMDPYRDSQGRDSRGYRGGGEPPRSPPRSSRRDERDEPPSYRGSMAPSSSSSASYGRGGAPPLQQSSMRSDNYGGPSSTRGGNDRRSPPRSRDSGYNPQSGSSSSYGYGSGESSRYDDPLPPRRQYASTSSSRSDEYRDGPLSNASRQGAANGPGDKPPGGSGEVCRKHLAGRCTFGDRCWHIHDPQQNTGNASRPRVEMNSARRKTVLCANFPIGTCRFGDRCSFAHGEGDLDSSAKGKRDGPPRSSSPHGAYDGGKWPQNPDRSGQSSLPNNGGNAYEQPPATSPHPQSNAPYGSSMAPPAHNPVSNNSSAASATAGYPSQAGGGPGYTAPIGGGYGYSHASYGGASGSYGVSGGTTAAYSANGVDRSSTPAGKPTGPTDENRASQWGGASHSTTSYTSQSHQPPSAAAPAAPEKRPAAPQRDEDEVEATGPEFTLQYDDDD